MNPRHEKLVLVLFSLAALAIAWVSGCAGMAEPLPTLAVAPDSLTVTTKVGNASSLPVTITNTGTVPVKVTEAVLSGTGFSMQGLAMPLNLIGGGSATFNVKFSASKVESVTGSVVFVTDARHRPAMLPLHGTGSSLTPEVSSILVSPAVATLSPSAKAQFTAAIQGATTNDSVTWTSTIGTINGSGVFTAPSNGGVGTIVATSVADPTKSATAIVAIKPTATSTPTPTPSAPGAAVSSVTVSPAVASSITGGTLPFSAKVQGTSTDGGYLEGFARHDQFGRHLYRARKGWNGHGNSDQRSGPQQVRKRLGDGHGRARTDSDSDADGDIDYDFADVRECDNRRQAPVLSTASRHGDQ